jgi:tetratricopeptide (TPR) repeat protein
MRGEWFHPLLFLSRTDASREKMAEIVITAAGINVSKDGLDRVLWPEGRQGPFRSRHSFILHACCLLIVAWGKAAAEPPVQSAAPRDATVESATYERCMKLARQNPAEARNLAQSWHERGGAHPADHCGAVALIGLKQYKEGATRLEALAQAMTTTAPAGLRAEVLDQAGQAWGLAGDPVRAYAAAGAAVALEPNDLDLLIDRAQAAAAVGYYDKAAADLDHVLKVDPSRVVALIYRASANRALDRLDPALADVEKAIARAPNSAPALLERGNIRRLKGDNEGALQDWERVGQLAPGGPADMAAKANIEHLRSKGDGGPAKSHHVQ